MRKKIGILSIIFLFFNCLSLSSQMRNPVVAGKWYPADSQDLSKLIDNLLEKAEAKAPSDNLRALVVPHAAYVYSGRVAAEAYKVIQGQEYDSVVIIGPSHRYGFEGVSIYPKGAYRTPLGDVPVDEQLASRLSQVSGFEYTPRAHEKEHSVEVQVPFIQKTLPQAKIVPVVMGFQTPQYIRTLSQALSEAISGGNVLVVVSTDMSHHLPQKKAHSKDSKTISLIESFKTRTLMKKITRRENIMCGGGAVVSALLYAQNKGKARVKTLKYADSSQFGGPQDRVVGYLAAAVYARSSSGSSSNFSLSDKEKRKLLWTARSAINHYVKKKEVFDYTPQSAHLKTKKGVFVTLKKEGRLRGCIGMVEPKIPLYKAVIQAAIYAACKDTRFSPVSEEELEDLQIQISVLSSLEKIKAPRKIKVGQHGLVVAKNNQRGLLLPQVAVENGWNRKRFLQQTCVKAGLPKDAWKSGAEIFIFEALVFPDEG
ncbi:AmmeMemoRadiSam system protein B [bacterium]|nr:AmmeMemoRadiSam system protein B [bacterium]